MRGILVGSKCRASSTVYSKPTPKEPHPPPNRPPPRPPPRRVLPPFVGAGAPRRGGGVFGAPGAEHPPQPRHAGAERAEQEGEGRRERECHRRGLAGVRFAE